MSSDWYGECFSQTQELSRYPERTVCIMNRILRLGRFFAVIAGVLATAGLARAATFSINPTSVSNFYSGNITLQIGGLTNGETVLVQRFLDPNGNGIIDAGEPLVQSFSLTDGQVVSIGGVRNGNIPGDNDLSANGQITATFNFAYGAEFSRGSGKQVFRVSSPSSRFAPLQQTFAVTQSALPWQITGTLSSGGSPLSFAWAGVLLQVGTDNEFLAATTADASGNFAINVADGTYEVIGFKPGYVGNFASGALVTISGGNTNVSVALSPGNLTLSGSVTNTADGSGIAGFQFFATTANNDYAAFFTDAQGNFNTPIITGQWKLDPSDYSALLGGYFRPQNKIKVSVGSTSVTGFNVPLTRGNALIYGTLKTDQNAPLANVRLYGSDSGNQFQSTAYSDAVGNYFLPASGVNWNFGVDNQGSGLPAGYVGPQAQVALQAGEAFPTNLVALRASAYLAGRAVDGNNNPIGGGYMILFGTSGQNLSASIASDGSFVLPANGGTWTLSLDAQSASQRNLVAPQLSINVTDGVNVSNITYVALIATRTISGSVKNITNSAVVGLNVFAGATLNGTNFNANSATDSNGNYSMPVIAGTWAVGLDSQGLAQRGYSQVSNQNVDTSSGSQTANFVVGGTPVAPTLSGGARLAAGGCQFVINGQAGQTYTIQVCTDLGRRNWGMLYVTNSLSNRILVTDPSVASPDRFYRVLVGP